MACSQPASRTRDRPDSSLAICQSSPRIISSLFLRRIFISHWDTKTITNYRTIPQRLLYFCFPSTPNLRPVSTSFLFSFIVPPFCFYTLNSLPTPQLGTCFYFLYCTDPIRPLALHLYLYSYPFRLPYSTVSCNSFIAAHSLHPSALPPFLISAYRRIYHLRHYTLLNLSFLQN